VPAVAELAPRGDGLLGRPATVHENIRPGNKAGSRRTKVKSEMSDFFYASPAANRDFGKELPIKFRVLDQRSVHLRSEGPRTDGVHGNSLVREFQRQCACQTEERGFARRVGRASGERNRLIEEAILITRP
jgi:hypothetical protein